MDVNIILVLSFTILKLNTLILQSFTTIPATAILKHSDRSMNCSEKICTVLRRLHLQEQKQVIYILISIRNVFINSTKKSDEVVEEVKDL